MPVPIAYHLRRLARWVSASTGLSNDRVVLSDQNTARPTMSYIGIQTLPGGNWDTGRPIQIARVDAPVAWTLSFAGVTGNDPIAVEVGPETIEIAPEADPTVARDAWLTAFAATRLSEDGWITAAASGASSAILTTGSGWPPPWPVAARQEATLAPLTTTTYTEIRSPQILRYRIQVYGESRFEAESFAGDLRSWSETDPLPGMRNLTAPTSLTIRSGADTDARAFVDLDLAVYHLRRASLEALAGVDFLAPLA